jgi:uncharacterized protein YciI
MARFVALLEFSEDEALRLRTRPAHREYLRSLFESGKLVMSGPWADETGAMLVYEAESLEAARELLEADPYRAAGVLADARIREWRVVFPE